MASEFGPRSFEGGLDNFFFLFNHDPIVKNYNRVPNSVFEGTNEDWFGKCTP